MDKRTIKERKSIFRFTAPPSAPSNIPDMYLSSNPHKKETAPPSNASKIKKAKTNFTFRFTVTGFGVIKPIINSPSVATANFSIATSGKKTTPTAVNAPINEEAISLFVEVGTLEKQEAK